MRRWIGARGPQDYFSLVALITRALKLYNPDVKHPLCKQFVAARAPYFRQSVNGTLHCFSRLYAATL